ncbi:MAG: hypothetical protein E6R07_01915 [Nevskiaceae bacterium]|nr:MAG: hypothetical protein E6R07_01915 [Nevskiaceae bacterium]
MDKRTLILTLATMAVTAAWADDIPQPERMTWEEQPAAEPPPAELQPPAAPVQVAAAPAPAADAVPMPTPVAPDAPPLVTTPPPAPSVAAPATPSAAAVQPAVRAAVSDAVPKAPYAAVRVDTGLRDRPVTTAAGDLLIAAGTLVHLSGKAVNAEGTWWFVTATGIGGGWLPESDLGPITR